MIYQYNYQNLTQDEFNGRLSEFQFSYQDCFCGERHYEIISTSTRTGQNFNVVRCIKCGTLRINPYMTESSTDKYYKEIYGLIKRGNISAEDLFLRQEKDTDEVYSSLKKYVDKNSFILDFGGGAGGKTYSFVKNGYNISILESDKKYHDFAIDKGFNLDNENKQYDLVVLLHVLEHIVSPISFLKDLSERKLNQNGLIYIEVPFLGGVEYQQKIINEIHMAHKWYFTEKSLDALVCGIGFEVIGRNRSRSGIVIKKSFQKEMNVSTLLIESKKQSDKALLIAISKLENRSFLRLVKKILKKLLCR